MRGRVVWACVCILSFAAAHPVDVADLLNEEESSPTSSQDRKLLGSSVVTSVSVIMDHGNGTKTYITDAESPTIARPEVVGTPGTLMSPDRYEFYSFGKDGELIKKLMSLEEIQGLIAGGDELNSSEETLPIYYNEPLVQAGEPEGVSKVLESVQNVLKGELQAAGTPERMEIPSVPDDSWSMLLSGLIGGDMNKLKDQPAKTPTTLKPIATTKRTTTKPTYVKSTTPRVTSYRPVHSTSKISSPKPISYYNNQDVKESTTVKYSAHYTTPPPNYTTRNSNTTLNYSKTASPTKKPSKKPETTTFPATKEDIRMTEKTKPSGIPTIIHYLPIESVGPSDAPAPNRTTNKNTTSQMPQKTTESLKTTTKPTTVSERISTTSKPVEPQKISTKKTTIQKPTATTESVKTTKPKKPESSTQILPNAEKLVQKKPQSENYVQASTYRPNATQTTYSTTKFTIKTTSPPKTTQKVAPMISTHLPMGVNIVTTQGTTVEPPKSTWFIAISTTVPPQKTQETTQFKEPTTEISTTKIDTTTEVPTRMPLEQIPMKIYESLKDPVFQTSTTQESSTGTQTTESQTFKTTNAETTDKELEASESKILSQTQDRTNLYTTDGTTYISTTQTETTTMPTTPYKDQIMEEGISAVTNILLDNMKNTFIPENASMVEVSSTENVASTTDFRTTDQDLRSEIRTAEDQTETEISTTEKPTTTDSTTLSDQTTPIATTQPKITTFKPKTSILPKATTSQPKTTAKITTVQPKITTIQPKVKSQPRITTAQPKITTVQAKIKEELKITAVPPKITTVPPKITTVPPKITTTIPKITTTTPKITTTTPTITTTPKITTVQQKITTNRPQVTSEAKVGTTSAKVTTAQTEQSTITESTTLFDLTTQTDMTTLSKLTTFPQLTTLPKLTTFKSTTQQKVTTQRLTTLPQQKVTTAKPTVIPNVTLSTSIPKVNLEPKFKVDTKKEIKPVVPTKESKLNPESVEEIVNLTTTTSTTKPEVVQEKIKLQEPEKKPDEKPNRVALKKPGYQPLETVQPPPAIDLHPAPYESMGLEASTAFLGEDVRRFADLCNELAFRLWTSMTGKGQIASRSIVMSPFAATSILAMVFLGARGSTSGQMNDILRLDDMVTFNPHQVLQNVTDSVLNSKTHGVATAAFVRELYSDKAKGKILDFYKERAQQYYQGHVEEINFNGVGDIVRRRTNLLVKRQTLGKIPEYLRGSSLSMRPPLAAFSANIFQTDCDLGSTEGRDGEMYFVVRPSTRQRRLVPVPAVVWRTGFLAGYEPSLDATSVCLGADTLVSTILILPGQQGQVAPGDGLARLEQRLIETSYRRGGWSRLLRSLLPRPGLELQIPRFSHRSVLNVTAALVRMGLKDLFETKADLRGLNGLSNDLHLSDMVQINTFSTCGEETIGARHHIETYPASPQRMGREDPEYYPPRDFENFFSELPLSLRPRQARLPDTPRLRFDRPFLYMVRHNPSGMILHMGRFNPRLLP